MKLYNRNGKIYADFSVNGKRYRRGLDLAYTRANLNHAMRNVVPDLIDEIEATWGLKRDYTLSEIIELNKEHWKSLKVGTNYTYNSFSKIIFEHLGDKNIKEYNIACIDMFFATLAKCGYSSSSQQVIKAILKGCFDKAVRLGIIKSNPVFKVRITPTKKINRCIYTKEQAQFLISQAEPELKKFLYFAIYTGARANEILALNWEDIKDDYIIISKTLVPCKSKTINSPKNGKTRAVFITPVLREYLYKIRQCKGRIFKNMYSTMRIRFKAHCQNLGLEYTGLHSLRHTFASLLLNDKVEPYVISQALGHSSLTMLEKIYGHFTGYSSSDKEAIIRSLDF
ncbi:site-specific integrase [Campylobacter sp. 19-13652]|uniref:site-specific integrase n=1 Tax=Campylobacter sp. 19-13652 TaxID=2840180 RepID=UPI001C748F01|nr:site-specific integrase [Campylobacter sp. 19-13652]BCX79223.1 site-specific integrase [Campylobacter sp. 19-13652]